MNITEFQDYIKKTKQPIIIDVWAAWCKPCQVVKPILEKLAAEYKDRVTFLELDADDSPEVLKHYHIMGIPTVLVFRDGELFSRVTGVQNEENYRALFESALSGTEFKQSMTSMQRTLRLLAGILLLIVGIITSTWYVGVLGAVIAFLGIYDRCPIWAAITRKFQKKV
ncbi:MAG TPA: hypothetical protein DCK95_06215 [Anaerolineaceae bacterium]|nr:hypothetical protein [Anaerolineaceae bacterium]